MYMYCRYGTLVCNCINVYFQSGAGVIHILIFDLPLTWSPVSISPYFYLYASSPNREKVGHRNIPKCSWFESLQLRKGNKWPQYEIHSVCMWLQNMSLWKKVVYKLYQCNCNWDEATCDPGMFWLKGCESNGGFKCDLCGKEMCHSISDDICGSWYEQQMPW